MNRIAAFPALSFTSFSIPPVILAVARIAWIAYGLFRLISALATAPESTRLTPPATPPRAPIRPQPLSLPRPSSAPPRLIPDSNLPLQLLSNPHHPQAPLDNGPLPEPFPDHEPHHLQNIGVIIMTLKDAGIFELLPFREKATQIHAAGKNIQGIHPLLFLKVIYLHYKEHMPKIFQSQLKLEGLLYYDGGIRGQMEARREEVLRHLPAFGAAVNKNQGKLLELVEKAYQTRDWAPFILYVMEHQ